MIPSRLVAVFCRLRWAVAGLLLLGLFAGGFWYSGSTQSRRMVRLASVLHDPSAMGLEKPGNHERVRRVRLPDHIEAGLITLGDGARVRYWFCSHHLVEGGDLGATLFRLPDGTGLWMDGYFCCEMDPPDESLVSVAALRSFAVAMDGRNP
jgi:hypothetical protein